MEMAMVSMLSATLRLARLTALNLELTPILQALNMLKGWRWIRTVILSLLGNHTYRTVVVMVFILKFITVPVKVSKLRSKKMSMKKKEWEKPGLEIIKIKSETMSSAGGNSFDGSIGT